MSGKKTLATAAVALLLAGLSCNRNRAPELPAPPAGPELCFKGTTYTFKATVVDPDGDNAAVRFDWGDNTVSDWVGLVTDEDTFTTAGAGSDTSWNGQVSEGDTIQLTHAWRDTGTYWVSVQAMDAGYLKSGWSNVRVVRVVLYHPPLTPQIVSGPNEGLPESLYTFATSALNPDGYAVAIRFAWGDGDTSKWTRFVSSGESVAVSHVWTVADTHAVTAQARDTGKGLSFWSSPHRIIIRPPDTLRRWRLQLDSGIPWASLSSPAIGPFGTLYVGSTEGALFAVNPDGTLKWRFQTDGSVYSSPSVASNGTVYVGSYGGWLYAVLSNGTRRWRFQAGGGIIYSPAIAADGSIYVGAGDGGLYALNQNGSLQWKYGVLDGIRTSPVIAADGTVYFGTSTSLVALNPDGTLKWKYGRGPGSDPAIGADGTIYFGSSSSQAGFYALNPDGTLRWTASRSNGSSSPAIGADGTICCGSTDNDLRALNPEGTLKWSFQTGGNVAGGPAIAADGTIYFGSRDNFLYARRADGTLKLRYDAGGPIVTSPTIGLDGTVYFTSCDGYLYALKGTSPLADSPWPKFRHDISNTGRVGGGR